MNIATLTATVIVSMMLLAHSPAAAAEGPWLAQISGSETTPGRSAVGTVTVRGTVDAVDKANRTVTLKGPEGNTLTLDVKDPTKLDVIKVGDPVVATYTEAVAFLIRKAGTATPGSTVQESRVGSKPGETPAGAISREITVTGTITAIDKKTQTVTIKGPEGKSATVKAQDPKNLERINVGDLVEIKYTQALAVSLDKPAN